MLYASSGPDSVPAFSEVVENVRNGHPEGLHQLYNVFRILSGSLRRQMGYQDFEDRMHDMFIVVAEAIREGKLREAGALPSYIYGVARLSVCSHIGVRCRRERLSGSLRHWVASRNHSQTPEDRLVERERNQIMKQLLGTLGEREREILTRFYIDEQTKEQICAEMRLTDTQFRLTKSRAKQRLSRIGQQHLHASQAEAAVAA